jgi:hypothetical protein
MELDELKTMWLSNDAKIEKRLELNEQSIQEIQTQRVVSKLTPLYIQRVIECVFHAAAIVLLVAFLIKNISQFPYAIAAVALLVFYTTIFISAFRQIILIKRMDFSNDLATIQSSLVLLQTHILDYAKLAVLFIPVFVAYPTILTKVIKDFDIKALADFDIIAKSNGSWWTLQWVAFAFLIPFGIWFYRQVTYKNIQKEWVKQFIRKSSGKSVAKALEFLKELQDLKHNMV